MTNDDRPDNELFSDVPHDPDSSGSADHRSVGGGKPSESDLAFDSLRAADPASPTEPTTAELSAIRFDVDRRIDADQAPVPAGVLISSVPAAGAPVSAAVRWMRVAAAVAGVAVIGATGYIVGARTSGSSTASSTPSTTVASSGRAAPAIALGDSSNARPEAAGRATAPSMVPGSGSAGGAPVGTDAYSSKLAYGGWWGRTVFKDGGLSTSGGSGEGWAYDPSQVVSAGNAAAIAAALGVGGTPVEQYGGWVVGPTDGTGPSVTVSGDGLGSVSFYDPTQNGKVCYDPGVTYAEMPASAPEVRVEGDATDSSGGGSDGAVAPSTDGVVVEPAPSADVMPGVPMEPVCPAVSAEPSMQGDQAIQRSRELLIALGQNPDAFEFDSPDQGDTGGYSWVSAYPVLNGQRTGQMWSFSYLGQTISNLYGQLAPVVSLGQYEVISPAEAVDRMNDPRFGTTGAVYPVDYVWPEFSTSYVEPTSVTLPPLPSAGSPIAWPVTEVTFTGAVLGVAVQWQADGSVLLVPAYSLTTADGVAWSVIAVADSELDFTPTS